MILSGALGRDVPDEVDPNESLARRYNRIVMAVVVEMQNVGNTANRAEIAAVVEHVLCDRPGDWRVSIVGSRESDDWEMKIEGPKGFERRYTLVGSAGGQQPEAIRSVLPKLLPA